MLLFMAETNMKVLKTKKAVTSSLCAVSMHAFAVHA